VTDIFSRHLNTSLLRSPHTNNSIITDAIINGSLGPAETEIHILFRPLIGFSVDLKNRGRLFVPSSVLQWNPRLTITPLTRPPRYYGHFILAPKKLSQSFSYLKNPFNTTIPLMRPIFHGPKVVALTGFHCIPSTGWIELSDIKSLREDGTIKCTAYP